MLNYPLVSWDVRGISGVMGIGARWDCCQCRLDGPNVLLQHLRDSVVL